MNSDRAVNSQPASSSLQSPKATEQDKQHQPRYMPAHLSQKLKADRAKSLLTSFDKASSVAFAKFNPASQADLGILLLYHELAEERNWKKDASFPFQSHGKSPDAFSVK